MRGSNGVDDPLDKPVCKLSFRHHGPLFLSIACHQRHFILHVAKNCLACFIWQNLIGNDPVTPLAPQLFAGICLQIIRLGGESNDQLGPLWMG